MRFALLLLLLGTACAKSSATAADSAPTEYECSPAKVGRPNAKPVPMWTSPCTPRGTLGANAKPSVLMTGDSTTITNEKDFAEIYDCKGAASGLDFTKEVLVVTTRRDSPGSMGTDILDDGAKVTFVQKEISSPCPNMYPPTPGPMQTFAFRVSSAPRTFDRAQCAVKPSCP